MLTEVEVDRPKPRPVEVLVRVHAVGVNPADWEARAHGWGGSKIEQERRKDKRAQLHRNPHPTGPSLNPS
ncbi:hypothetical protein [Microtetraspora malaysiensis]|uniref:hypothetical protein n=1 Tax=Microtetraspora malaysiensis TaxID=161358 RepID=UPI000B3390A5|nr:hypothetical protein [Microtetraspora malaysiensis]